MNPPLRPTHIRQPGPPSAAPLVAVTGRGRRLRLRLDAGKPLLRAVVDAFAMEGFAGGTVCLDGLALGPFAYCRPALSPDDSHAAFYSATLRPEGVTRVTAGAMTFGSRDGAPAFHAHATWVEADGGIAGGHLLPDGSVVAETVVLDGFGLDGAAFRVDPDAETGFSLFGPVPAPSDPRRGANEVAHALRLCPNRDFAGLLESFCHKRSIAHARIEGGVGSTIGALFEDGGEVTNFATEVHVSSGRIAPGADGLPVAELDVGLVDYTGALADGRLVRGDNPVLMTFELVLVEETAR
jgi:predicted DNA-binding protein with PD1-like motif